MEVSMIFEDNVTLPNTAVMSEDAIKLTNENSFLRNQNEALKAELKELQVSLEQAIGPKYNSLY
jgi:chaperonin cofactor prefoldin